jgi:hypothetical protein
MAALHQHRARPTLPARIEIAAIDRSDELQITFETQAAAQLIAADPVRPGYSFIHEIAGRFTVEGRLRGEPVLEHGSGVFEYVD